MKKEYQLITDKKTEPTINYSYVIIVLVLVTILLSSLYIYNKNSSKLIRYLKDNNYICEKNECFKIEDNNLMIINVEDITLTKTTDQYTLKIKNNEIVYENRATKQLCSFTSDNFDKTNLISEKYSYTSYCQEYITTINEVISEYKNILQISKINLQK